ncbi:MAG TPA: NADH:ubiquinone reductase (Na(+)-transporting) subunit D [Algoriphagus sp.]|jgi:Na+-transporting NADH:ubiquinone oxidoreductase subunit D|uniref:NADH:ubiquinone reductase (Na(+)-transporting) subunit D n=2 Tax=Algoriphagus TaxID=246875 RepID=UPI000C557346|nr:MULTISPECIES: NADH:ubiquinone reductase (Na(+)-transporting) subunit D [unclassified Algoriphagus]MAL14320.1 NADH:ubiquinone reductase (Na(+)-transporting) subunit D [Algoriphagus sp.]MAN88017.1 NADH:ubiquinone reductase (Na(+)-transporting) subunit D [Algoriphagus sp.]HCD89031.1 NADH:ubiquinone reductase (Na(+)-transporting) subunit D [Algoriphagus sp.]HCH44438.1 NADH:ubiquinone reductase (Na(+)-transporting) subunit D [Algoriphagus sp.]|tara:strand:+ start:1702 stop:2385 length:684 start_codon:yes stop_codon:yes gene_type:complete
MSAETIEKAIEKKPAEALLSKRRKKLVTDPLVDDNPITIQVLGICSALAVTTQMKPTLVMAISVIFVVVMSNLAISLLRNTIPTRVRIIVQLAVVATLVTLVSEVLKAFAYDMYKELSVFVGLIITNCIVMGRLEAFALGNKPYDSVLDGLGSALGYSWIILAVAFFRELLGSGSVFGVPVYEYISGLFGPDFKLATNGLMVSSVGAFIILGLIIWVQRTITGYVEH